MYLIDFRLSNGVRFIKITIVKHDLFCKCKVMPPCLTLSGDNDEIDDYESLIDVVRRMMMVTCLIYK